MATIDEQQDRWDGGIATDGFSAFDNQIVASKNLDAVTQNGRFRPYRGVEDISDDNINRILKASDGEIYGLENEDTDLHKLSGTSWSQVENTTGDMDEFPFDYTPGFEEHQGFLYWYTGLTPTVGSARIVYIDRYELDGGTYTSQWARIVYGGSSNPTGTGLPGPIFRATLNDRIYFALANSLYELDSWDDTLFDDPSIPGSADLPSLGWRGPVGYQIVSLTEFDRYIVIGMKNNSGTDSKVFFWDSYGFRASFVRDIPNGELVSVRNMGDSVVALATQNDVDGRLMVYNSVGGQFYESKFLIERNTTGSVEFFDSSCFVRDNEFYFGGVFGGMKGIFKFGTNSSGRTFITLDRSATDDGSETSILSVMVDQDTFYTVHSSPGEVTRTDGSADYDLSDVYAVTKRWYGGDLAKKKQLLSVSLGAMPAVGETFTPAAASLELSYRIDDETAWVSLGSFDVTEMSKEFIFEEHNITIRGYNHIQFRIDFTGLAQLVKIHMRHEYLPQTYI